nr:RWD domain-containing protein [Oscillochloris trichoides]
MDTTSIMLLVVGGIVILMIVIGAGVILIQRTGATRRNSSDAKSLSSSSRPRSGTYVPPAAAPPLRPPTAPPNPHVTTIPPRSVAWGSGTSGVTAPEVTKPTLDLRGQLEQELAKLRSNGYSAIALNRRSNPEEYCLQVRVNRSQGENVSIHLICPRSYPMTPPTLVSTIEVLNNHGEIAEQQLALESKLIQVWKPDTSLFAIINEVFNQLPYAQPNQTPPAAEPIFSRYPDRIA